MFTELTREEQYKCNGGIDPLTAYWIYKAVKTLFYIAGGIFVLGSIEGCAAEAAKDIEESKEK